MGRSAGGLVQKSGGHFDVECYQKSNCAAIVDELDSFLLATATFSRALPNKPPRIIGGRITTDGDHAKPNYLHPSRYPTALLWPLVPLLAACLDLFSNSVLASP